ncbi:MAG: single-stranded DNA-binding protein [Euryarchaeota archaeon]|nr:single-stranded DNA-binding protein [Euryarchaeota archaeon]
MSFASLKKSTFTDLLAKAENLNKSETKSGPDERLWKPEVDKAGNGYAVIRFLPAPDGEDLPWAQVWSHAFQGPGGWYIENSLTTLGKKDPVSDLNRELWNSGAEGSPQRTQARNQKRKLNYYSNIYVVKDSANPSNEGKVFLYRFGKKIFDKVMESMQPAFEDETPVNPFDFWKGADFKLKITRVAGFWNYDKSEFDKPSVLGDLDDKELEGIWKTEHSLAAFTADDQFKTYEELKGRLESTLKGNFSKATADEDLEDLSEGRTPQEPAPEPVIANQGEDDTLSYFAQLAKDD